jgi:AcrR family transcriptional regulator
LEKEVARTVNSAVRAVRYEAFVDVALRLIQAKGYEQMSIQDVLDELDASRGAFYHYFDSKAALLDAVVERIVHTAMAAVAPIVADPGLPAPAKLDRLFAGIAGWKAERRELMLALIRVWRSDENAIVREKCRQRTVTHLAPLLAAIVRQGIDEGVFSVSSPDDSARVLVSLLLGAQEHAGDLFFARQAGTVTFEAVEAALAAYSEAWERLLGMPAGSLRMVDPAVLRLWFG